AQATSRSPGAKSPTRKTKRANPYDSSFATRMRTPGWPGRRLTDGVTSQESAASGNASRGRDRHRAMSAAGSNLGAAFAERPGRIVRASAACRSLDAGIEPIVVQRAAHGAELFAELLCRRGHGVGVGRLPVLPDFDDGEVVRPVVLLPSLEALGTRLLAAVV